MVCVFGLVALHSCYNLAIIHRRINIRFISMYSPSISAVFVPSLNDCRAAGRPGGTASSSYINMRGVIYQRSVSRWSDQRPTGQPAGTACQLDWSGTGQLERLERLDSGHRWSLDSRPVL